MGISNVHEGGNLDPSGLPPGFRFHPTDEELVSYYLTKKVTNSSFAVHTIAEVGLNKCEPWDLPGMDHHRQRITCFLISAERLAQELWVSGNDQYLMGWQVPSID